LSPELRWAIFLGGFILHWVGTGIVVPSWAALASRNIPDRLLGRYFGFSFAGAGAAGVVTGALGAWLVTQGGLDWGYAVCCALAFALQITSAVFLSRTRPIGPAHTDLGRLWPFLKRCWKQVHSDRAFQALAVLVVCMQLAGGATQLFTAGLKEQGVPDASFQWLNPAMALGGMLGSFWLGHLFDRRGAWRPWLISFSVLLASLAVLVWGGGGLAVLALAYLGAGLFNAVYGAVNLPWILSRAGTAETPAFMGLINTLLAPAMFLAPYCLGRIARSLSVNHAFAVSGLATLACVGVLLLSPSLWKAKA
jgi:MFS family permease